MLAQTFGAFNFAMASESVCRLSQTYCRGSTRAKRVGTRFLMWKVLLRCWLAMAPLSP
jgi:hypothetical protein